MIDRHRINIHLVSPYSKERRKVVSEYVQQNSITKHVIKESNFNYQYGLGFDTAYYRDMKESIDDAA